MKLSSSIAGTESWGEMMRWDDEEVDGVGS